MRSKRTIPDRLRRRFNDICHGVYKTRKKLEHARNKLGEWWRKPTQGEHIEMLKKELKTIRDQRDRFQIQAERQRCVLEDLRDRGLVRYDKYVQGWSLTVRGGAIKSTTTHSTQNMYPMSVHR